jgi:serine/threonine protein kinase/tetratricopeptide (TPR) repeat protein
MPPGREQEKINKPLPPAPQTLEPAECLLLPSETDKIDSQRFFTKNRIILDKSKGTFGFSIERDPKEGSGPLELAYLNLVKLEAGTDVNQRYRLEKLIGQGGFGIVFQALDMTLNSRVAIKFLNPRLVRNEKKFLRVQREINLSRKISDGRIIKIFSLESWREIHFLVMELAAGRSLKSLLQEKGRYAWPEFKGIFLQIVEAVGVLHRNGIVHRDLKPANILVEGNQAIKILDFGLAKEVDDMDRTSSVGEIVGSPQYMSPEQIRGESVDCQSDVYQMGLILYRALSGRHPFDHTSTMEVIFRQLNQRPEPIVVAGGTLPRNLRFGLEKALEKSPARRFRDAGAMARFFRRGKVSWPQRLLSVWRRGPFKWLLAGAALTVLALLAYRATAGSPAIHQLVYRSSVLEARNRFGVRLWQKDFSPLVVHHAFLTRSRFPLAQGTGIPSQYLTLNLGDRRVAVALLVLPAGLPFPTDRSITDDSLLCQRAVIGENGEVLRREPLLAEFEFDAYDYIKVIKPHEVQTLGVRSDGEAEIMFTVQQYQSMYPSALVYERGLRKFVFTHPGTFVTTPLERGDSQASFMLFGINNLFAHMSFVAEVAFNTSVPGEELIRGIPNFEPEIRNNVLDSDRLFILPFRSRMFENRWRLEGRARFSEENRGDLMELDRKGRLTVQTKEGSHTFYDPPDVLRRIYTLVNLSYQEKMMKRNPGNALALIREAVAFPLQNPYLRSALVYMQGDLQVDQGMYREGEESLRRALELFPGNNDASERLCELEALRGDAPAALRRLSDSFSDSSQFWGFSTFGVSLFKAYLYLGTGLFSEAEAEFDKIGLRLEDIGLMGRAEIDLFRGSYASALDILRPLEKRQLGALDVRELRLLLGRALLLAGQDPERANFLISDISRNSLEYGHLAEVSACYFLARSGRAGEAVRSAREAFARLREQAQGDFMTRLWLFYDAYVYGLTMELAGDRREAEAGYRACIEANPHAELAARSRLRLKSLARTR